MGFVRTTPYDVDTGLHLLDLSREEEGNVILLEDRLVADGGTVPTDQLLVSDRSVLRRDRNTPASLYYQYGVGRGQFVVQLPDVPNNDPDAAQKALRAALRLVRDDGTLAQVSWDVGRPTFNTEGWVVDLYLDRRNRLGQIIWVQYNGWDLTNNVPARNQREIVNSTPISTGVTVALTNADLVDPAADMAFVLTAGSPADFAPAISLFAQEALPPSVTVTATTLTVAGSPAIAIGSTIPVRDVVNEINRLDAGILATALNDSFQTSLVTGLYVPKDTGEVIRFLDLVQVKFNTDRRIRAEKPWRQTPSEPWYARIQNGVVLQDYQANFVVTPPPPLEERGSGQAEFRVQEFDRQAFSVVHGAPYRDLVGEQPLLVSPTVARTRRAPLKSVDDLTVYLRGRETSLIKDVDLQTGTIFLATRVERRDDLLVDYTYEEKWFEYKELNLNALPPHNQNLLSKYVAIFMVPARIKITDTTYTSVIEEFERTVYHVIDGTYEGVLERANNLSILKTNEAVVPVNQVRTDPLILGVYRVVQSRDIDEATDFIDARTQGGGWVDSDAIDFEEAPEARMVWDEGYWDGEPFPSNNVLIADLPDIRRAQPTGEIIDWPEVFDAQTGTGWASPTGRLTNDETQERLSLYVQAGSLVIPEYESEEPVPGGGIAPGDVVVEGVAGPVAAGAFGLLWVVQPHDVLTGQIINDPPQIQVVDVETNQPVTFFDGQLVTSTLRSQASTVLSITSFAGKSAGADSLVIDAVDSDIKSDMSGTTSIPLANGTATFLDLAVSEPGTYRMNLTMPLGVADGKLSDEFTVSESAPVPPPAGDPEIKVEVTVGGGGPTEVTNGGSIDVGTLTQDGDNSPGPFSDDVAIVITNVVGAAGDLELDGAPQLTTDNFGGFAKAGGLAPAESFTTPLTVGSSTTAVIRLEATFGFAPCNLDVTIPNNDPDEAPFVFTIDYVVPGGL